MNEALTRKLMRLHDQMRRSGRRWLARLRELASELEARARRRYQRHRPHL